MRAGFSSDYAPTLTLAVIQEYICSTLLDTLKTVEEKATKFFKVGRYAAMPCTGMQQRGALSWHFIKLSQLAASIEFNWRRAMAKCSAPCLVPGGQE